MKRMTLTTVLSLAALASFANTSLDEAEERSMKAREIQESATGAPMELENSADYRQGFRSFKTYHARSVCYKSESRCIEDRSLVHLLSSNSISFISSCVREYNCGGLRWVLKTHIRILR